VTPDDVIGALAMLLRSRAAWIYAFGFPYFYISAKREKRLSTRLS